MACSNLMEVNTSSSGLARSAGAVVDCHGSRRDLWLGPEIDGKANGV